MRTELSQRLAQRLSPVQLRLGRLLEMTSSEVEDEVRAAVDENPAIEVVEAPEPEPVRDPERLITGYASGGYSDGDHTPWEPLQEAPVATLHEQLDSQLGELDLNRHDMDIARYIIGNIDDNGYLTRSVDAMASDLMVHTGEDIDSATVSRLLDVIRHLEPAGVGARDLRECMLLQLRRRAEENPDLVPLRNALTIVSDHYDELALMHLDRIASRMKLNDDAMRAALDQIRSINPKPGAAVAAPGYTERVNVVSPDFVVESDGNRLTVSVPNRLPELAVAESFAVDDAAPMTPRQRKESAAMAPYRDEATTLIKALKMRQETLLAVMKAIAGLQKTFFMSGDTLDLRPMLLKDVAALTGYDISTVSRATNGKYVAAPSGIYPLKMLFNERTSDDTDATAHEVMAAIRQIIDTEDGRRPLSDDAIADALASRGLTVARRTVTKYRERMGIPTSRLRRGLS